MNIMMNKLKQAKMALALACTLLAPGALVVTIGCSGGCSVFKGAPIATNADPVVVHAERAQQYALATFDEFLAFEKNNRAAINEKAVWDAADHIRANYQKWDNDLLDSIRTYKAVRTQENASKIDTTLALIRQGLAIASHYYVTKSATIKP